MATMSKKEREKKERKKYTFGHRRGRGEWDAYVCLGAGLLRILMLPDDEARLTAKKLFLLGFDTRLHIIPPTARKAAHESADCEEMWQKCRNDMDGKLVLGVHLYPDTAEFILDYAKEFFLQGFRAGTIAANEFAKQIG